jgi:hypothetical protein
MVCQYEIVFCLIPEKATLSANAFDGRQTCFGAKRARVAREGHGGISAKHGVSLGARSGLRL